MKSSLDFVAAIGLGAGGALGLAGTLATQRSLLFALTAMRMFSGEAILPASSPLPFFAYPFLVLTFGGWISTLLKRA